MALLSDMEDKQREVLAYIAGIIDGEGTITLTFVHKKCQFRAPVVSVSSTSYEILLFLQKHYAGSLINHKTYKDHHKRSWVWKIAYDKAISFLADIYPYLLDNTKRYRANLLLTKYKEVTPRNGRYSAELRQAKERFEQDFFQTIISNESLVFVSKNSLYS